MNRRENTIWEEGLNCIILLSMAINFSPFIPRSISQVLGPVLILVLLWTMVADRRKRRKYREGELERERQDERSQMVKTEAVWYCHVAENFTLLALFLFAISGRHEALAGIMLWILAARNALSFGIRWWLDRKY